MSAVEAGSGRGGNLTTGDVMTIDRPLCLDYFTVATALLTHSALLVMQLYIVCYYAVCLPNNEPIPPPLDARSPAPAHLCPRSPSLTVTCAHARSARSRAGARLLDPLAHRLPALRKHPCAPPPILPALLCLLGVVSLCST